MKTFNQRVYAIVAKIPKGKVTNYGQIALLAGNKRASRAVGYGLHAINEEWNLPCHRVVFKDGSLTPSFIFGGKNEQYKRLKAENISFTQDKKVMIEKHFWSPKRTVL